MTVLIDTGVVYADHDENATRHNVAENALEVVYDGGLGQPYISEYVIDESVTLTMRRGSRDAACRIAEKLAGTGNYPPTFSILWSTRNTFDTALEIFNRYRDRTLSFTDAMNIAHVRAQDLDGILSFDDDFDGIVARFDPSDVVASG